MSALTKAAPEMGNQHLAHGGFVAHQLYQLIDAVLLQQVFRTLLHGVEQRAHMAAGAAKQVSQLVERGLLRLPLAALPEADKLLLQTTGRHKRGTPDKKPAIYLSLY